MAEELSVGSMLAGRFSVCALDEPPRAHTGALVASHSVSNAGQEE